MQSSHLLCVFLPLVSISGLFFSVKNELMSRQLVAPGVVHVGMVASPQTKILQMKMQAR